MRDRLLPSLQPPGPPKWPWIVGAVGLWIAVQVILAFVWPEECFNLGTQRQPITVCHDTGSPWRAILTWGIPLVVGFGGYWLAKRQARVTR